MTDIAGLVRELRSYCSNDLLKAPIIWDEILDACASAADALEKLQAECSHIRAERDFFREQAESIKADWDYGVVAERDAIRSLADKWQQAYQEVASKHAPWRMTFESEIAELRARVAELEALLKERV